MGIFSRRSSKKKATDKIIVKRGDDVRVYTKAGTLLGVDLQQVTKERDKPQYGKER